MLCVCASVVTFCCAAAHAQLNPAYQQELDAYRDADQALNENERGLAMRKLNRLIEHGESPRIRNLAQFLKNQIEGEFRKRQQLWLNRKIVDQLVIVPDEATYYRAIAHWTDEAFWPVMIEDSWFTPMFIQAFKPKRIMRYAAGAGPLPVNGQTEETESGLIKYIQQMITDHNADQQQHQMQVQAGLELPPPGVVVLDPKASQRAGGMALALGRAQPIIVQPGSEMRKTVTRDHVEKLNEAIMGQCVQWNVIDPTSWFGITLAGDYPYRYQVSDDPNAFYATDDALGRGRDKTRQAVVGRLMPTAVHSIYMAMCSLFLHPKQTMIIDTYADKREQVWEPYKFGVAARMLKDRWYDVDMLQKNHANVAQYRKLVRPVNPFDLFFINAAGGVRTWNLIGQPTHHDMPMGGPNAMYMVHSFSATDPYDRQTLSGAALWGGTYWFFGSVFEPYLNAYTRPTPMMIKMLAGTPMAFAARHAPELGPQQAWRLYLIGDPLYALREHPPLRIGHEEAPVADKNLTPLPADAPPQATQSERLVHHLLQGQSDQAVSIAQQLISQEDLNDRQLSRVALILLKTDDYRSLLNIPPAAEQRIPFAPQMAKIAAEVVFSDRMNANDLGEAAKALPHLLRWGKDSAQLIRHLRKWLIAMGRSGNREIAMKYLNHLGEGNWSPAGNAAIDEILYR